MSRKRYLNNQILLSAVALLVIFVLSVSITFSWIEGGTTYTMETENSGDVKTESDLSDVDYNGTIKLNPSSQQEIDLFSYDNTTNDHQDIFFSPVSSFDGKNFYFPINMTGQSDAYRVATTNDIGTKYVSFDFNVEALKKCFIAFNGAPTITATRSGSPVTDTSAFRIMISDGTADGTHIFSPGGEVTGPVVQSISGTSPTMTSFKTEAFDSYCNNVAKTGRLYSYAKNDTGNIQVSIWLDAATVNDAIFGADIAINLGLVVVADDVDATFNAVTYDKSGNTVTNGFTGGSIKYGEDTHTSAFNVSGTSFTATAVPNQDYEFKGWYTDKACTKLVSTLATMPKQTPDNDINYYAKFQEVITTTIYVEERTGFSTYAIYLYRKDGGTTYYYTANGRSTTNNWPGVAAKYDSETGYYYYEFKSTDEGNFNVIISNNGSSQYPAPNEEGLVGTLGGTYLFTAGNQLNEFDPDDMITFKVVSNNTTLGTAHFKRGNTDNLSNAKLVSGDTVTLKATPTAGNRFVGWYKDSTYTTKINNTYTTATQDVTITGTEGSTITYYAKFEKIPVLTVKTSVTPTGGGTATVNSGASASVQSGKSVNLVATPSSDYEFVGWYTDSGCTTTIGDNFDDASTTYTVTGTDGATVNLYAKFKVKETTRTVYFIPNSNWKQANARFACYVWTGNEFKWYSMSDGNDDGAYSATIDKSYENIIFCRMNPAYSTNSWDKDGIDYVWNQTSDQTIQTDGNDLFTLSNGGDGWNNLSGSWSQYVPPSN